MGFALESWQMSPFTRSHVHPAEKLFRLPGGGVRCLANRIREQLRLHIAQMDHAVVVLSVRPSQDFQQIAA